MSGNADKFACPACHHRRSVVEAWRGITGPDDTEDGRECYRRLRRCLACGQRYTTVELMERVLQKKSSAA